MTAYSYYKSAQFILQCRELYNMIEMVVDTEAITALQRAQPETTTREHEHFTLKTTQTGERTWEHVVVHQETRAQHRARLHSERDTWVARLASNPMFERLVEFVGRALGGPQLPGFMAIEDKRWKTMYIGEKGKNANYTVTVFRTGINRRGIHITTKDGRYVTAHLHAGRDNQHARFIIEQPRGALERWSPKAGRRHRQVHQPETFDPQLVEEFFGRALPGTRYFQERADERTALEQWLEGCEFHVVTARQFPEDNGHRTVQLGATRPLTPAPPPNGRRPGQVDKAPENGETGAAGRRHLRIRGNTPPSAEPAARTPEETLAALRHDNVQMERIIDALPEELEPQLLAQGEIDIFFRDRNFGLVLGNGYIRVVREGKTGLDYQEMTVPDTGQGELRRRQATTGIRPGGVFIDNYQEGLVREFTDAIAAEHPALAEAIRQILPETQRRASTEPLPQIAEINEVLPTDQLAQIEDMAPGRRGVRIEGYTIQTVTMPSGVGAIRVSRGKEVQYLTINRDGTATLQLGRSPQDVDKKLSANENLIQEFINVIAENYPELAGRIAQLHETLTVPIPRAIQAFDDLPNQLRLGLEETDLQHDQDGQIIGATVQGTTLRFATTPDGQRQLLFERGNTAQRYEITDQGLVHGYDELLQEDIDRGLVPNLRLAQQFITAVGEDTELGVTLRRVTANLPERFTPYRETKTHTYEYPENAPSFEEYREWATKYHDVPTGRSPINDQALPSPAREVRADMIGREQEAIFSILLISPESTIARQLSEVIGELAEQSFTLKALLAGGEGDVQITDQLARTRLIALSLYSRATFIEGAPEVPEPLVIIEEMLGTELFDDSVFGRTTNVSETSTTVGEIAPVTPTGNENLDFTEEIINQARSLSEGIHLNARANPALGYGLPITMYGGIARAQEHRRAGQADTPSSVQAETEATALYTRSEINMFAYLLEDQFNVGQAEWVTIGREERQALGQSLFNVKLSLAEGNGLLPVLRIDHLRDQLQGIVTVLPTQDPPLVVRTLIESWLGVELSNRVETLRTQREEQLGRMNTFIHALATDIGEGNSALHSQPLPHLSDQPRRQYELVQGARAPYTLRIGYNAVGTIHIRITAGSTYEHIEIGTDGIAVELTERQGTHDPRLLSEIAQEMREEGEARQLFTNLYAQLRESAPPAEPEFTVATARNLTGTGVGDIQFIPRVEPVDRSFEPARQEGDTQPGRTVTSDFPAPPPEVIPTFVENLLAGETPAHPAYDQLREIVFRVPPEYAQFTYTTGRGYIIEFGGLALEVQLDADMMRLEANGTRVSIDRNGRVLEDQNRRKPRSGEATEVITLPGVDMFFAQDGIHPDLRAWYEEHILNVRLRQEATRHSPVIELTRTINRYHDAGFDETTVEGTRAEVARFGDYDLIITRGEEDAEVLRVHNVRTNDFQTLEVPIQGAAHFVPNDRLGDATYFPDLFQEFIAYLERQGETQIAAAIASLHQDLETADQRRLRLATPIQDRPRYVAPIPRPLAQPSQGGIIGAIRRRVGI